MRVRRCLTALAAFAAIGAIGAATAPSAMAQTMPKSDDTWLVLSVESGSGPATQFKSTVLTCDPMTDTHPHAAEACAELSPNGDFTAIGHIHQLCPLYVLPVTARAVGWWRGQFVDHSKTYLNSCRLHLDTRSIFEF